VTLFCDDKIYGDGAVGLALLQGEQGTKVPEVRTEFVGVQRLGGRMTITRFVRKLMFIQSQSEA
jgi:hypothetical protein